LKNYALKNYCRSDLTREADSRPFALLCIVTFFVVLG